MNEVIKRMVDTLQRHACNVADGAAINYKARDQEEESSRTFEINVEGQPMRVTITAHTLP